VEVCLTNALAARTDLRAAEIGLEAAGKRIGLARAETFTLAAGINGKDVGSGASKEFLVGPSLDLAVPILNQNQGGVAQARAKLEKAARQYYTVRDRIVLEVREAHTRLAQAQESHDQWQQRILPPLEESVRQAEKAYAAGNLTYLFVLENNRKLYDARAKAASAAADLRRARAELERSAGRRLDADPNALPPESK
jgi:cobalt-zinc-cadmium efflux system outer membrane protein